MSCAKVLVSPDEEKLLLGHDSHLGVAVERYASAMPEHLVSSDAPP